MSLPHLPSISSMRPGALTDHSSRSLCLEHGLAQSRWSANDCQVDASIMFKKILNHWPTKVCSIGFISGRGGKQYFKKIAAEGTKQNKSNFCFRDTEETSLHSGIMDVLWELWIWARFEKAWYARISQWGNSDGFWSGVLFEESDALRLIRQRYTRLKMVEKLKGHCNNWGTRWQVLT